MEDVSLFLRLHITKDLEQLSQALGKGADDTVTSVHLVLRSLQELPHASNCKEAIGQRTYMAGQKTVKQT